MLEKLSKVLLLLTVSFYLFHLLFFWIFESTDSYFYIEFANFLRTGKYLVNEYLYINPSTMEPPLYSTFLSLAMFMPRADIIIHFVQLGSIMMAGYFLYKIFCRYAKKTVALLLAILFLLTPAHMIYTGNLVAEPIAIGLITGYLYVLSKVIAAKNDRLKADSISFLLIFSSVMVLQRYNLILFYILTVFLTAAILIRKVSMKLILGLILSLIILSGWVVVNFRLNGSLGLSNAEGKHLYNRIFHFDRLLPPSDNPDFLHFQGLVANTIREMQIDYFMPWWYYEPDLIYYLGSETAANEFFLKVSLAALFNNPVKYILDTPGFFLFAHGQNPTYHDPLYRYNGTMKTHCRVLDNIHFCTPIIALNGIFSLWDGIVNAVDWYYLYISPFINYLVLFPAIIFSLMKKDIFMRMAALLYVGSILFFVLVEAPLPRYTYIFTPLKTLLIGYFVLKMYAHFSKKALE